MNNFFNSTQANSRSIDNMSHCPICGVICVTQTEFAEPGLYFTGVQDNTRCDFCGVGKFIIYCITITITIMKF